MNITKYNKGTSMVEFAILAPFLVVLLFGVAEFGIVLYCKAVITNASREGARAGIRDQTPKLTHLGIDNIVGDYCSAYGLTKDPVTTTTGVGDAFGQPLTVQVTYPVSLFVIDKFVPGISNPLNLSAKTVMRME